MAKWHQQYCKYKKNARTAHQRYWNHYAALDGTGAYCTRCRANRGYYG